MSSLASFVDNQTPLAFLNNPRDGAEYQSRNEDGREFWIGDMDTVRLLLGELLLHCIGCCPCNWRVINVTKTTNHIIFWK